jgi:hypothetical protein
MKMGGMISQDLICIVEYIGRENYQQKKYQITTTRSSHGWTNSKPAQGYTHISQTLDHW